MSGEHDDSLLGWRVKTLEAVEASLRAEVHELREKAATRDDHFTKAEAQNVFVTRKELQLAGERQRQWPVIVASVTVALVSVTDLILTLSRAR